MKTDEPIALIGLACRFPGAPDPGAYWRMLRGGEEQITPPPPERQRGLAALDSSGAGAAGGSGLRGGYLEQIDGFDPLFFAISPREAAQMDPQQRLMLELSWEALEDAGLPADRLRGSATGVFFGVVWCDYAALIHRHAPHLIDQHTATSLHHSIIANRVSYALGLEGPSMSIDASCASSLVAAHLACESLRRGESTVALAGGVNLNLAPDSTLAMSRLGVLSPNGRSYSFDARANGYVRGEGGGIIVLKPLDRAIVDGDQIYAVIRGSAVNNNGSSPGLTAPSLRAQQALLRAAYARAGVDPSGVHYVEAHGPGTPLGDPVEARALGTVCGACRAPGRPLLIGSVKATIGHLEAAAGIAGLIKVALALRHREIPPSLHFERPNAEIPFAELGLEVVRAPSPWPGEPPAIAGVSAFGFGGTNCHVVLEERGEPAGTGAAAGAEEGDAGARSYLLPLSARSPGALVALLRAYQDLGARPASPPPSFRDMCFTAGARRAHHRHRAALIGRSLEEALASAELPSASEVEAALLGDRSRRRLAFVFAGQGSQWVGMSRQLLAEEPVFLEALLACDELSRGLGGWSLRDALAAPEGASLLHETRIVQPVLFAVQVALARLFESWGASPDAVIGHSFGEVAAAHVAGALTLEDALRIVHHRGRVGEEARGSGRMVAVEIPAGEAERAILGLEDRVSIAAINDDSSVVLSGEAAALGAVLERLRALDPCPREVRVDYASHSPRMDPFQGELARALRGITPREARIPILSTVEGAPIAGAALGPDYWARNLRQPVRFADAVGRAIDAGCRVFLELGPHPMLTGSIERCLAARAAQGRAVPTLRRGRDERRCALEALRELYLDGVELDFARLFPPSSRCVSLPGYPWQRERYWMEELEGGDLTAAQGHREALERSPSLVHPVVWRSAPSPRRPAGAAAAGSWLVIADEDEAAAALTSQLHDRGGGCRQGVIGRGPGGPRGVEVARVDPEDAAAVRALVAAAFADGLPRRGVVVLLGSGVDAEAASGEGLQAGSGFAGAAVIHAARALVELGLRDPPRLWLVTRGARAVGQDGAVATPASAAAWGLARAIAAEHPELRCACVDLDPAGRSTAAGLLDELLDEGGEAEIALRGEQRWVARLARPAPADPGELDLAPGGAVLIAGGLSALGLATAAWMVSRGARDLVLVDDVAHARAASSEAAAVEAMRAAGARVSILEAEVRRQPDLAAALADLDARGAPLRGVVHVPAAVDAKPLSALDRRGVVQGVVARAEGAWRLHALTAGRPLDFFLIYASAMSLLGAPGCAAEAAADALLAALTEHRRGVGLPARLVRWGPFAEEPGAGAGMAPIDRREGIRQLGALPALAAGQIVIAQLDPRRWLEAYPARSDDPFLAELDRRAGAPEPGSPARQAWPERLRAAAERERAPLLEQHVLAQAARVLRLNAARIDPRQPLGDLGLDSMLAVELRGRLASTLGLRLRSTLLFTHPSVASLTGYLLGELGFSGPSPAPEGHAAAPARPAEPPPEAGRRPSQVADEIAQLSDAEAEAALLASLEAIQRRSPR